MTGDGPRIVIEGRREDWPGGARTLTPREPGREPNRQVFWFGAELHPSAGNAVALTPPAQLHEAPEQAPPPRRYEPSAPAPAGGVPDDYTPPSTLLRYRPNTSTAPVAQLPAKSMLTSPSAPVRVSRASVRRVGCRAATNVPAVLDHSIGLAWQQSSVGRESPLVGQRPTPDAVTSRRRQPGFPRTPGAQTLLVSLALNHLRSKNTCTRRSFQNCPA